MSKHVWKDERVGYRDYCKTCGVAASTIRRYRRAHRLRVVCPVYRTANGKNILLTESMPARGIGGRPSRSVE